MNYINKRIFFLLVCMNVSMFLLAQNKSIPHESNGKTTVIRPNNQFSEFIGEGTLVSIRTETVKNEILKHGEMIRKAFSEADVEKIKSYHHPEVIKALGYNDIKTGREEVIRGLEGILENYTLEFIKNEVESILVNGDIAIEQTKFSIKGTPKKSGESFLFNGRTMVTYIRYKESPTGWATIREIIQPATK